MIRNSTCEGSIILYIDVRIHTRLERCVIYKVLTDFRDSSVGRRGGGNFASSYFGNFLKCRDIGTGDYTSLKEIWVYVISYTVTVLKRI